MNLTTTTPISVQDLEAQGFTADEIGSLQTLRDRYRPVRESCESNREYEQLCFLKWRYEQGQIERG